MRCYICDDETDREDDNQPLRFICKSCDERSKDEETPADEKSEVDIDDLMVYNSTID